MEWVTTWARADGWPGIPGDCCVNTRKLLLHSDLLPSLYKMKSAAMLQRNIFQSTGWDHDPKIRDPKPGAQEDLSKHHRVRLLSLLSSPLH